MDELLRLGHRFLIVQSWFSLHRTWQVYGPDGALAMYAERPWLRLRQEFVVYADEAQLQPLFTIRTRRLMSFNREHDILDALSGTRLGTLRTRGLASIWRDTWDILGPDDQPAGLMEETGQALLRRVFRFLPGQHRIELGGREVALVHQIFRLFRKEFELEILQVDDPIEPRFAVACALVALLADVGRERSA
jgi:uncharacterized protein YxjI